MTSITRLARHSRYLSVLLILSVLAVFLASAQNERRDDLANLMKDHAAWSPSDYILDNIRTHRIVMLADGGHGVPLYMQTVTNTLNQWVTAWEQSGLQKQAGALPSKLYLILETDSIGTARIEHYFDTGKPLEVIVPQCFVGYQFTVGELEFYEDLRSLRHRIDQYNQHHADARITFDLVGPEKHMDLTVWTPAIRDTFFVKERDEYSSARIEELLKANPSSKALIFYGGAHLERQRVAKLGNNKGWGYYMAHYLTDAFAAHGGVFTCSQLPVRQATWLDDAVLAVGRTFAMDNSFLYGAAVKSNSSFLGTDGTIYLFSWPREVPHISKVFSENLVNLILDSVDAYADGTKEYYTWILDGCFQSLSNLAGKYWRSIDYAKKPVLDSTIKAWKQWHQSAKLDIVDDIASLQYYKRMIDHIRSADENLSAQFRWLFSQQVGFIVWFPPGVSAQVKADSLWSNVYRYRKPIILDALINMLWVASPSEHDKAITVLRKETGLTFSTAKEWTNWWRALKVN
jgi:hypothetical protein